MRQRVFAGVVLVLALARPASAELGFFRWWDSLSGPGPFSGIVFDPVFVCYGTPEVGRERKPIQLGCWNQARNRWRVNVGVDFARLTGHNNLPYASGAAPDVTAYPFMATVTVSKHAIFDVGGGVGFVRFSGHGFGFNKAAFEARVTLKPLVAIDWNKRKLEFLQLCLFGTGIPGDLTAADFGATGPWRSSGEWLPGFMVVVDLSALVR